MIFLRAISVLLLLAGAADILGLLLVLIFVSIAGKTVPMMPLAIGFIAGLAALIAGAALWLHANPLDPEDVSELDADRFWDRPW